MEIEGRDQHINILGCIVYQLPFTNNKKENRFHDFDKTLSWAINMWSGIFFPAWDINNDLFKPTDALTTKYLSILQSYNFHLHTSQSEQGHMLLDHV